MRCTSCGGFLALLLVASPGPASAFLEGPATGTAADTSLITVGLGVSMDAHADRLATPFRQSGTGFGLGLEYRRGGFSVETALAASTTSSAISDPDRGFEDTWAGGVDVSWVRPVAGDRTRLLLGAGLAGLGFVRRHDYGAASSREYYADLLIPLSLVGEVRWPIRAGTGLEERLSIGGPAILFRSPFASTKSLPGYTLVSPATLRLARHRLTLEQRTSDRTRITVTHALTFYDTSESRPVRVVAQELRVGLSLLFGVGAR